MVYLFLENGFEETEAIATLDFALRGGVDVKTVSKEKYVTGNHNITVKADLSFDEISFEGLEGVILPGGLPGTTNLENNQDVIKYLEYCHKNSLMIAAICAAPSVPGKLGFLKGRKATCYPSFEEYLTGADAVSDKAVSDGNIITGKAMGAAIPFGYKIVEYLKGKEKADQVLDSIYG